MDIEYLVKTVMALQYNEDIETLDDLQFYIYEHFDLEISKEDLKKYFSEDLKQDEYDLQLQFKHLGI